MGYCNFLVLVLAVVLCSVLVSAVVRPEQALLHLTRRSDVVQVSFVTKGGKFLDSEVQYGNSKTSMTTRHACSRDTYKTVPNWDPHGVIHTCKITGVKNMKTYYYRVGSKTEKEWSGVKTFTAQHIHPPTTRLAISGDLGAYPNTSQYVVNVMSKRKDFGAYVTCGDLAYAGGNTLRNDKWGQMNQKLLSRIPQIPVYGNHEQYDNNGLPFDRRYNIHMHPTDPKVHWHSLDIGTIHLSVIDNLYDQSATSPMVQWLEADLAAARTKRASGAIQHIVVSGHYPLYSQTKWTSVLKVLEPIFMKYGVDMYVCGHVHEYQRTYPLNNIGQVASTNKTTYINPKGVVHVTIGTGGYPLDTKSLSSTVNIDAYMVMHSRDYYGYLLLTSQKTGVLTAQFIDTKSVVRDAFTIQRFSASVAMAAPSTKRSLEEEAITESADDDADLDSIDPEEVNDDVELTSDDTPEEDEKEDEDNDRTVDFGEAFGSSNEGSGWKVTNTDVVEGTDCFTIGSNAWELAVPAEAVYEANITLLASADLVGESTVLKVEGESVCASKLSRDANHASASVAAVVKDGRLTISSPNPEVALCGVKVKMATGTPVQIQVNPSAPSEFGANHRDANGGFHVDNTKIASAFKQMTGHDAERFVVTDTSSAANGDLLVSVLVRDLPSDADLSASESLAEFSALSGDSFWKRSGLQIERMEVGDKKQALPTWSIVTIATVVPVIAAVALVVIVVLVLRHRRKLQNERYDRMSATLINAHSA